MNKELQEKLKDYEHKDLFKAFLKGYESALQDVQKFLDENKNK